MPAHHLPLSVGERSRLEQDGIWNAHLAYVVQQRATANMDQLPVSYPKPARQLQGQLGDSLAMALGFFVRKSIARDQPSSVAS